MTEGEIKLTFVTTTKDWSHVQSVLKGWALRRENMLAYVLTHKGMLAGALNIVMAGVCIFMMVSILPKLLAGNLAETFSASTVLYIILVGYALWRLGRILWKTLSPDDSSRTGREGVHWGRHHVLATTESLSVRLSDCRSVYDWNAFLDLRKTKDLLLLQLTTRSAVAIPRQALKSKADEMIFCDFVQSRISK